MPTLSECRLQFQTCRLGQADVQQQASGTNVEVSVEQFFGRAEYPVRDAFGPQQTTECCAYGRFIIHDVHRHAVRIDRLLILGCVGAG
ncbi:hypothetical protein D9M71_573210 [compost metagenome]